MKVDKLESDKNESFSIIKSREKESIVRNIKKTKNVRGKPLRMDEKPRVSKGECPLLFQALYYMKDGSFSCTMMVFYLKERPFLYLTSLQTFYSFL